MAKSFRIRETGSHIPGMPSDTKGNMIFTPQQVEAIDLEQNRIRISGSEQEAMMAMIDALSVVELFARKLACEAIQVAAVARKYSETLAAMREEEAYA